MSPSNDEPTRPAYSYSDAYKWRVCVVCGVKEAAVSPLEGRADGIHLAEHAAKCARWAAESQVAVYNREREQKLYDLQNQVYLLEGEIARLHEEGRSRGRPRRKTS